MKRYLPDTSSIIEEILSKLISEEKVKGEILIHRAVLAELEHQANQGKPIGLIGLDEIKRLLQLSKEGKINLRYVGERPKPEQIKMAKRGEIDALIRDYAWKEKCTLVTCDNVQYEVALASNIDVIYFKPKERLARKIKIETFFTDNTMSVHLKEGSIPIAKIGRPGNWKFKKLSNKELTSEELKEIGLEIIETSKLTNDSYIETERPGSIIIQHKNYRIVITKPPLSEKWEITAVRPIKKLSLEDYKLDKKLIERFDKKAEGILIAGAPGMGKSTFAQALAVHYLKKNKLVRTIEAPRDLILPNEITQYSKNHATQKEIIDILLLSRPDYTVFDEIRSIDDFMLFSELRLAGIGLIGVVHATTPIDAVQRFVGKVELGMIPHIIDTIVFIKDGEPKKILELNSCVKVPTGMTEKDLARPVIEVRDFLTKELEYEIFVFGEETVVMPVERKDKELLEKIRREFKGYKFEIKNNVLHVYVPKKEKKKIVGVKGKRIRNLEKRLGIPIEVEIL